MQGRGKPSTAKKAVPVVDVDGGMDVDEVDLPGNAVKPKPVKRSEKVSPSKHSGRPKTMLKPGNLSARREEMISVRENELLSNEQRARLT